MPKSVNGKCCLMTAKKKKNRFDYYVRYLKIIKCRKWNFKNVHYLCRKKEFPSSFTSNDGV